MSEEKPLLSIGDDGIKINLKKGDSFKTNANKIFMQDVKQNVKGGTLDNHATEDLTQIGNMMEASDGGKILNEVVGGTLTQRDNQMKAGKDGLIINRVSKKIKTAIWIILISSLVGTIGFLADITSLYDRFFH
ncbi:MAG: hypothetical protein NTZ42_01910 [Candidatus Gribaldobacteria bacterium]|nr:hypothetical protein [Candidatus Gribaldobacteria bacterium]